MVFVFCRKDPNPKEGEWPLFCNIGNDRRERKHFDVLSYEYFGDGEVRERVGRDGSWLRIEDGSCYVWHEGQEDGPFRIICTSKNRASELKSRVDLESLFTVATFDLD